MSWLMTFSRPSVLKQDAKVHYALVTHQAENMDFLSNGTQQNMLMQRQLSLVLELSQHLAGKVQGQPDIHLFEVMKSAPTT
jgi:hypothetical protein